MSAAPPGVDGAMMRIGRVGQSAADAPTGWMQMTPEPSATAKRFIWSSTGLSCLGERGADDAGFAKSPQAATMSHAGCGMEPDKGKEQVPRERTRPCQSRVRYPCGSQS